MSNAARHSFQTESDPSEVVNPASAGGYGALASAGGGQAPIVIASADAMRAFDLFQPEPSDLEAFDSEPSPSPVVPIADGQFARQVARALDAPQPATGLNLPLGGIAPTEREIASARALMVGWIAACAIAAFAFLSQGPSVSGRAEDSAPAPAIEETRASLPGDIRLDPAAAAKPGATRAKKVTRDPAPAAVPSKP
jgi:hypothetical protein